MSMTGNARRHQHCLGRGGARGGQKGDKGAGRCNRCQRSVTLWGGGGFRRLSLANS